MKREEGQALVLACLMMLILSIAVLSTVNLGQNIYERQRLQNTADAAAYSMAALEARAFNFYAFVNRTHVSHYVTAMTWQSILSFTYFTETFLVEVYGIAITVDPCIKHDAAVKALCHAVLDRVPVLNQIYPFIERIIDTYLMLVKGVIRWLRINDPDKAIGTEVIPTYFAMNSLLTGAAEATLQATLMKVVTTSNEVVLANDRNVPINAARLQSGLLSTCILSRAHMREAWHTQDQAVPLGRDNFVPLDPLTRADFDKVARAKRAMGQVSNATRFGLDRHRNGTQGYNGPGWVTSRKLLDIVDLPPEFKGVEDAITRLGEWKWGQTKMISAPGRSWVNGRNVAQLDLSNGGNRIRDWQDPPGGPDGALAQGDELGADDIYRINLGPERIFVGALGVGVDIDNPLRCNPTDDPVKCWGDPRLGLNDPQGETGPHAHRFMLKTSIWSSSTRPGIHYRLVSALDGVVGPRGPGSVPPNDPGDRRDIGLNRHVAVDINLVVGHIVFYKWVANVRGVLDGNHPWEGIAPFPHFEPGDYEAACGYGPNATGVPLFTRAAPRDDEFNQPSSFAMLQKSAAQLKNAGDSTGAGNNSPALLGNSGTLNFGFSRAGTKLQLDNTRKDFMGGVGLNVISRGQTYYHRPGNWHEHPNFFNPYWRPRLASVQQGSYANPLVEQMRRQLPPSLSATPQKAMTH